MTENEKIDQHVLNKYKVIKKIGSGAYGHVWKVSPQDQPKEIYALKKVFEAFQHETDAQRTFREISILKKLEHSNVIKLHEVLPSVSNRDVYLVFEYMTTDLYRAIYQSNLQQIHKKYILYQLLKGLHYLHSAQILHRDLKPSNLLLSQQCQLKICDFGLARHLNFQDKQSNVLTEGVATRWYRAPEVLLGSNKYDQKADLWSVGCIFAQMIGKTPLFNCSSTVAQFQRIIQVVGRPNNEELQRVGEVACCLISQCGVIRQKPAKELFGHSIDQKAIDLLYKLLQFDPAKRLSASQALHHPYLKQFFRQEDLQSFQGTMMMEADQNVKLSTEAYRQLISKHFISKEFVQPQRFGDLKREREKSFGKILQDIHSRKTSSQKDRKDSLDKSQRKNNYLFEQIIKERNSSCKGQRVNSSNSHYNEKNKENVSANQGAPLDKFSNSKAPGTFAALRKTTAVKFNK